MKTGPLISILTLVHNQRPFVEQTIRSVMSQTYQNWEWIILDDGSADGTGGVITNIRDERIKYLFQENIGFRHIAENYNKTFWLSRGELVSTLDGDDYWPTYKLEVQAGEFDDPSVVLSYGECCIVNQRGEKIGYMPLPEDPHVARNDPIGSSLKALMHLEDIGRYFLIHDCTVMVRRKTLLDIGGFVEPGDGQQDVPTWARLALEGRFGPVPLCLGYWRRHPMASTFDHNAVRLFDDTIDFFRMFFKKNEARLKMLAFPYKLPEAEERWSRVRQTFLRYHPYNRAMTMLRVRSFEQARMVFRDFLRYESSTKNRLIYALIVLSLWTQRDFVHPLIETWDLLGRLLARKKSKPQGRFSPG